MVSGLGRELWPVGAGGFRVGEFLVAAAVAEFADQFSRLGEGGAVAEEPGAVEMDIGQIERHRPALGDPLRLRQIGFRLRRAFPAPQGPGVKGGGEEGLREGVEQVGRAEGGEGGLCFQF